MKFRLPRRLKYLRKARHWHGHGIHSPFLFYLVTRVIEDKRQYPAYRIIRSLKEKILNQLKERENPCDLLINAASLPDRVSKNKLFKKVELGYRYGKLLLRLINEFKPSSVFLYGPTFGMNLLYLALADQKPSVYVINFRTQERTHLLPEIPESKISFEQESKVFSRVQEFSFINFPFNPQETKRIIEAKMKLNGEDDVMIIRGIHKSAAMEALWRELITDKRIRVSLDLYEIGILLFRNRLQKQHFVIRF
jgi:hypothetical protein